MNAVSFDSVGEWNAQVPLLIVGAGAAGICAALAAKELDVDDFGVPMKPLLRSILRTTSALNML